MKKSQIKGHVHKGASKPKAREINSQVGVKRNAPGGGSGKLGSKLSRGSKGIDC